MPIADLYGHPEHRSNLAHFAALASLAAVDGEVNPEEKTLLDRFAFKLGITDTEFAEVMKKSNKYPIDPHHSTEGRLERLYDLFRIIYVDHSIEEEEQSMIRKYALGLGFSGEETNRVIKRSIEIFGGKIPFEDYLYLVQKK